MIIDNADDAAVFFPDVSQNHAVRSSEQTVEPLSDYLPHSPNGSILITSRNQNLAERLTGIYSGIIQVMPMNKDDALALLEKKLGFVAAEEKASDLVDMLEAMPLALTQAAAFIRQQAPRMSVSKYVDAVRRSDKDQARLLGKDVGDSRRDSQATNSIIATWQISFEHIQQSLPTAANLLSLMSMFDRQGIPERLLQNRYNGDQGEEADFDDDLRTLLSFSLVRTSANGSEFEMHRLVQLATKKWLELHNKLEKWRGTFAMLMKDSYPLGEYENWPTCQPLFPHVQAMLSNRPKDTEALEAWALVLHNAATYMFCMGQYNKASELCSVALQVRESTLGPEHPNTLQSLNDMGVFLGFQGQHSEANVVRRRALEARNRVLGEHHPDTLESINGLALTFSSQGQYKEAEELQVKVLQRRKKMLGEEHPETLRSMTNLAMTYIHQGRYKDSEEIQADALQKSRKVLGEEHPETLRSMTNLAITYIHQGRYKDSEEIQADALQKSRKALGEEQPDTLASIGNLASTYWHQGYHEKAEKLQVDLLQKRTRILGAEHLDTLTGMHNLACTWAAQGRYTEAVDMMQRCLEIRRRIEGADHPYCNISSEWLAIWEAEQASATNPKKASDEESKEAEQPAE
jgi:tetratricopeptide (TPR) repeat protein